MASKVHVKSTSGPARVIIAGAQGKPGARPVEIGGPENIGKSVGKDNWARTVFTNFTANVNAAHLICGATLNQPGGWSSRPPHNHGRFTAASEVTPSDVPMEEVYYFRWNRQR